MNTDPITPWRISLHGGHTGEFCDHAHGTLRETLDAAVAFGYRIYGVAEHAARDEARFLYPEEVEMGWDIAKIQRDFETYAHTVRQLAGEYKDRITVLCGFEADNIPADGYAERVRDYRNRLGFDYVVGSAHYVDEVLIDGHQEAFDKALEMQGGLEPLAIRYYAQVAEMVEALKPEIVGHLDVIRKCANAPCDSPAIQKAAGEALEVIREHDCILDCNTGGYRKGHGMPYPAPWLTRLARDMGIPFCFGDDSHAPEHVGIGLNESRDYLLEHGVISITTLVPGSAGLDREVVPL